MRHGSTTRGQGQFPNSTLADLYDVDAMRRNCGRRTAFLMTPWISSIVLPLSPEIATRWNICLAFTRSSLPPFIIIFLYLRHWLTLGERIAVCLVAARSTPTFAAARRLGGAEHRTRRRDRRPLEKLATICVLHDEPAFSELFLAYLFFGESRGCWVPSLFE